MPVTDRAREQQVILRPVRMPWLMTVAVLIVIGVGFLMLFETLGGGANRWFGRIIAVIAVAIAGAVLRESRREGRRTLIASPAGLQPTGSGFVPWQEIEQLEIERSQGRVDVRALLSPLGLLLMLDSPDDARVIASLQGDDVELAPGERAGLDALNDPEERWVTLARATGFAPKGWEGMLRGWYEAARRETTVD